MLFEIYAGTSISLRIIELFAGEKFKSVCCSEVSEQVADEREDFSFLRKEYRKEFIIASYNINSLQSNFVVVKEWLDERVFDVLTIQETKID